MKVKLFSVLVLVLGMLFSGCTRKVDIPLHGISNEQAKAIPSVMVTQSDIKCIVSVHPQVDHVITVTKGTQFATYVIEGKRYKTKSTNGLVFSMIADAMKDSNTFQENALFVTDNHAVLLAGVGTTGTYGFMVYPNGDFIFKDMLLANAHSDGETFEIANDQKCEYQSDTPFKLVQKQ